MMKTGLSLAVLALLGHVSSIELRNLERPADEICDGDAMDNRQLEDEGDVDDDIVDDNGFVKQWDQRELGLTMLNGTIRMFSEELPSNEVANGDKDDDKELQDEGDPKDDIVDDNGFVRQWDSQQRSLGPGGKKLKGEYKYLQLNELPSNEVANGDSSENKQLEDEDDANDDIVDDNGFTNQYKTQIAAQRKHKKSHMDTHELNHQINYLMNQHNEFVFLNSQDDVNSNIGTLPGQTNTNYQSMIPVDYFKQNQIMPGSHITIPRDDGPQPMRNNAADVQLESSLDKYSDELCNGDSADDREIHEDEDMNDDVVDYNGQTNAGYGSTLPKTYFDQNKIMDGAHIQTPRDDGPQSLRNNVAQN